MLKYRLTSQEEVSKLDVWVLADPAHKHQFTGNHFTQDADGVRCIEVLDDEGAVFYLKFTSAVLVEAQFAPLGVVSAERTRAGLREAFAFFSLDLKKNGVHAMLFDSVSEGLIGFFEKFGFKRLANFFKVNL